MSKTKGWITVEKADIINYDLTWILIFFAGRHLVPGHRKDPEDHDLDPLKSQEKSPGLSPVLLTDLTRSQRKANTDNVNIFYDAVTYWKCGFVFVPEQSV